MLPRVDVRAKGVIGAKRSKGEKLLLHRDDGGIEDRTGRETWARYYNGTKHRRHIARAVGSERFLAADAKEMIRALIAS